MQPVDKFGKPIYPKTFAVLKEQGGKLVAAGYREASKKPNLFYLRTPVGVFFADMRGTEEVPTWEDPRPLFYWSFHGRLPLRTRQVCVYIEWQRLVARGVEARCTSSQTGFRAMQIGILIDADALAEVDDLQRETDIVDLWKYERGGPEPERSGMRFFDGGVEKQECAREEWEEEEATRAARRAQKEEIHAARIARTQLAPRGESVERGHLRNPAGAIEFDVAGVLSDGRQRLLMALHGRQQGGEVLAGAVEREADSHYDPNAIKVVVLTGQVRQHLGYVPRELACRLAGHMDAGGTLRVAWLRVVKGSGKHRTAYDLRVCLDRVAQSKDGGGRGTEGDRGRAGQGTAGQQDRHSGNISGM